MTLSLDEYRCLSNCEAGYSVLDTHPRTSDVLWKRGLLAWNERHIDPAEVEFGFYSLTPAGAEALRSYRNDGDSS